MAGGKRSRSRQSRAAPSSPNTWRRREISLLATTPGTSTLPWDTGHDFDLDEMVGHQGYRALDMKFTTSRLLRSCQQFWAVAGPTHNDRMPPFSWSNTNLTSFPLYSPIKTFDFTPQVHAWSLSSVGGGVAIQHSHQLILLTSLLSLLAGSVLQLN